MNYWPHIDGLRAVAVLLVLCFHAGFAFVPSGFIGVDMFFVISGFLITGIIHHALKNNNFSFITFYSRRLWRLQPVLLCLIAVTAIMALIFYLPDDLLVYFKSARKTSVFISNTFFEHITTNYFAPDNNQLPLLHTWSLSIEWQCYLLLPFAIYLMYRIAGTQHLPKIFYGLTLIFLLISFYCSLYYPGKTYYQTLSRIFEFLIGACVALTPKPLISNKPISNMLDIIALTTLFYLATVSGIHAGFPNGYGLLVCLATAILLASGDESQKTLVSKVLSLKAVVLIGLISYSLYIWHWPILVLIRYLGIEETPKVMTLAFVVIFIMAYASWRFIEVPARHYYKIHWGYTLALLLIIPLLLIHLADSVTKKYQGYPQRFDEIVRINMALEHYASKKRPLCLEQSNVEVPPHCLMGSKNLIHKKALMIGDSYSNHLWRFIDSLAADAHVSVLAHATSACLTLPGISQYDWNAKKYDACYKQTERYYSMIKRNHYDYVVLGHNWNGYLNSKLIVSNPDVSAKHYIESALDKALAIIIESGARPVLIKSIALSGDPHACFLNHIKRRAPYDASLCDFDITRQQEKQGWQDAMFAQMKNKYPQLITIDPKNVQCIHGLCKTDINGIPVFRDAGHLTDYASFHMAKLYLQEHENPFVL